MSAPLLTFRTGQQAAFLSVLGMMAILCRRQYGKSYLLAAIALDWMLESVCDVIFASASLRLGQENIKKEADLWRDVTMKLKERFGDRLTTSADDDHGRLLDADAVADLFERQKLETRYAHGHSQISRSIVVAPNPDTAVGWTGNIILDEVGRIPDFQAVYEAMEPIVSSNKQFRVRMATTPPPDDAHYSYELLCPPPELAEKFDNRRLVNPAGNRYVSTGGIAVHRVDAWDAAADGVPLYDLKTREALTPEESRARTLDKTAWDRNYAIKFIRGGLSAVSLHDLQRAQTPPPGGIPVGAAAFVTDQLSVA